MIYVTADTHFGHRNILEFCLARAENMYRHNGDDLMQVMENYIVDQINAVVGQTDQLYFVGDFGLHMRDEDIPRILKRIVCKHAHLVVGNHDCHRHGKMFESSSDMVEVKWNHQRYVLCHYPLASWRRNAIMLHGHWHGTGPTVAGRLDIGVDGPDGTSFRGPWSLEEAKEFVEDRDKRALMDHTLVVMFDERKKSRKV